MNGVVTKFFVMEHGECLEEMCETYQTWEAGCDSVAEAVRNAIDFNSERGRVIGLSYAEFTYFKLRSEICLGRKAA